MKPKILLENENILLELKRNNNVLVLTSERVRQSDKGWGYNDITSILLKEISSITVHYRSNILFVILAVFAGLYSFITIANNGDSDFMIYSLLFTGLMVFLFFVTRRQSICIRASNGKIDYDIRGYSNDKLLELIDTIELAINKNILTIC